MDRPSRPGQGLCGRCSARLPEGGEFSLAAAGCVEEVCELCYRVGLLAQLVVETPLSEQGRTCAAFSLDGPPARLSKGRCVAVRGPLSCVPKHALHRVSFHYILAARKRNNSSNTTFHLSHLETYTRPRGLSLGEGWWVACWNISRLPPLILDSFLLPKARPYHAEQIKEGQTCAAFSLDGRPACPPF